LIDCDAASFDLTRTEKPRFGFSAVLVDTLTLPAVTTSTALYYYLVDPRRYLRAIKALKLVPLCSVAGFQNRAARTPPQEAGL